MEWKERWVLSRGEVKAIYDRLGSRQDRGAYYEDVAIADLMAHADFAHAQRVFEFGCGTGRVAADLLAHHLPSCAGYYAVDLSSTMAHITATRLARWADRTLATRATGFPHVPCAHNSMDRFVSMYVLDILAPEDIRSILAEAHRVLTHDGRLCLISLTHGATPYARLRSWGWSMVYALRPQLLGGCRPISLQEFLVRDWDLQHVAVTTAGGMSSEVIIATPR